MDDGEIATIPASALYSEPVQFAGLLGRYFANPDWAEPEALARIDEQLDLYFHVTPLPRPYTVEWTGKIAIPESGRYSFGLISIDESELWIDGETVTASHGANEYSRGERRAEGGAARHPRALCRPDRAYPHHPLVATAVGRSRARTICRALAAAGRLRRL